jgi:hypothetical protein
LKYFATPLFELWYSWRSPRHYRGSTEPSARKTLPASPPLPSLRPRRNRTTSAATASAPGLG